MHSLNTTRRAFLKKSSLLTLGSLLTVPASIVSAMDLTESHQSSQTDCHAPIHHKASFAHQRADIRSLDFDSFDFQQNFKR